MLTHQHLYVNSHMKREPDFRQAPLFLCICVQCSSYQLPMNIRSVATAIQVKNMALNTAGR